MDNYFDPET